MVGRKKDPKYYGLLAEYTDPEDLIAAAKRAHAEGYRNMDAYTPFPVHGLSDAIGFKKTKLPAIVLCGGLTGAICGFGMQYIANVWHYPINIGGRPLNSWPAFIIPTFEMTILFSAFSAVLGMLALNGLPQPYHPLFNVPAFELASRSHFFLTIEATDPKFNIDTTRQFLEALSPKPSSVHVVPSGRIKPPRVALVPGLPLDPAVEAGMAPPISQAGGYVTHGAAHAASHGGIGGSTATGEVR
jgi:hypothetical protein